MITNDDDVTPADMKHVVCVQVCPWRAWTRRRLKSIWRSRESPPSRLDRGHTAYFIENGTQGLFHGNRAKCDLSSAYFLGKTT